MFEVLFAYDVADNSLGKWEESSAIDKVLSKHKLTIIKKICHKFDNRAYTIVFILGESHCIIHTYPESNIVYVNLFSCNEELSEEDFLNDIAKVINGRLAKSQWVRRNVL